GTGIQMLFKRGARRALGFRQKSFDLLVRRGNISRTSNDLDAVTSRQNHPFTHSLCINQTSQRHLHSPVVEGEALAHFNRRTPVVKPYNQEVGIALSQIALHVVPATSGPREKRPAAPQNRRWSMPLHAAPASRQCDSREAAHIIPTSALTTPAEAPTARIVPRHTRP